MTGGRNAGVDVGSCSGAMSGSTRERALAWAPVVVELDNGQMVTFMKADGQNLQWVECEQNESIKDDP